MCEDFPCCGHEQGCCPSYDDNGQQTNMICTCGAELPLNNRFSICDSCLRSDDDDDRYYDDEEDDYDNEEDDYDNEEDDYDNEEDDYDNEEE